MTATAARSDDTFWSALPVAHRVALFAAPLVVVGALGPFATGMEVTMTFREQTMRTATRYGIAGEGWLIAAPAIVGILALLLVHDRQKRAGRAFAMFGLATLVAFAEVLMGGQMFDFSFFGAGTLETSSIEWGPWVALLAGLVATGGALVGSRDPDAKPLY